MNSRRRLPLIIGGGAIAATGTSIGGATPASAASFEVTNLDDAGPGSLRQAIIDANNAGGQDIITFQSGLTGVITLSTGQLPIYDSVEIRGPGASAITISGGDTSRVFYLYNESLRIDVVISGLTVRDGAAPEGAGIINWDENLTLDKMVVTDNHAADPMGGGGGVFALGEGYSMSITASQITGNTTAGAGGGVYLSETCDCPGIQSVGEGFRGGVSRDRPTPRAVPVEPGDIRIVDSTISDNSALYGGGVFAVGLYSGRFVLDHSTVSNNDASSGGGMFLVPFDESVVISESTISTNHATGVQNGIGGGIFGLSYIGSPTPATIEHTTIAGNTAPVGGGLAILGDVNVDHVIVGDNTAELGAPDVNVLGTMDVNHSLVENPDGFTPTGANNIIGEDPQLGALADNGGPTLTHLPALTSPAVDSGDAALVEPIDGDQRHSTRIVSAAIDMGAVEAVGPPVNDAYVTAEDTPLVVPAIGVLANDPDGANSAASAASSPAYGTVILNADGSFTYTPNAGYHGPDSFAYTQTSVLGVDEVAVVSITVTPVNDPPVAVDDSASAADNGVAVPVAVLTNDTDPDGDAITVTAATQGSKGAVAFTPTGVTYTPNAGTSGADTFTYTISDGVLTATATVSVSVSAAPATTVEPVLAPPIVEELPATGSATGPSTELALGLLGAGIALTAASRRRFRFSRTRGSMDPSR